MHPLHVLLGGSVSRHSLRILVLDLGHHLAVALHISAPYFKRFCRLLKFDDNILHKATFFAEIQRNLYVFVPYS